MKRGVGWAALAACVLVLESARGEVVYFGDEVDFTFGAAGHVISLDTETGDRAVVSGEIFERDLKVVVHDAANDRFVAGGWDGALFAIDESTGEVTELDRTYGMPIDPGLMAYQTLRLGPAGELFASGAYSQIVSYDIATGTRTSANPIDPNVITVSQNFLADADGSILVFVLAFDGVSAVSQLIRVDPSTGAHQVVSCAAGASPVGTGPELPHLTTYPAAIEADGSILAASLDLQAFVRIDPATGDRTVVSGDPSGGNVGAGPTIEATAFAALLPDGRLVYRKSATGIAVMDPATGNRTVLSESGVAGTGPAFQSIGGIAVDDDGGIVAVDDTLNTVLRVDPTTGDRTAFAQFLQRGTGPELKQPLGLLESPDGDTLLYVGVGQPLISIDKATGDRTVAFDPSLVFSTPHNMMFDSAFFAPDGTCYGVQGIFIPMFPVPISDRRLVRANLEDHTAEVVVNWGVGFPGAVEFLVADPGELLVSRPGSLSGTPPAASGDRDLAVYSLESLAATTVTGPVLEASPQDILLLDGNTVLATTERQSTIFVMLPYSLGAFALRSVDLETGVATTLLDADSDPLYGTSTQMTLLEDGRLLLTRASSSSTANSRAILAFDLDADSLTVLAGWNGSEIVGSGPLLNAHVAIQPFGSPDSAAEDVPPGDPPPVEFVGTGVTIDFAGVGAGGRVVVTPTKRPPASLPGALAAGFAIAGLSGQSFQAAISFVYPDPGKGAPIDENGLSLWKSEDGTTWTRVDSVVDADANTVATAVPQTSFSWWAVAPATSPANVGDWAIY